MNPAESVSSAESHSEVSSGFPMRWAAVGIVVAALLMWGLYAWPQPESETAVGGQDSTEQTVDEDDQQDVERDDPGGSDDSADAGDTRQDNADDEPDRSSTTTEGLRSGAAGAYGNGEAAEDEAAGPVVGELTGLGVIIGGYDSPGAMSIVALDTGETSKLEGFAGRPIGMIGTSLVGSRFGEIFAADLVGIEPQRTVIFEAQDGWTDYAEVRDDKIWTVSDNDGEYRMIAFSADGQELDQIDLSELGLGFGWPVVTAEDGLVQSSAGGVFRRYGSGYERLSTGRIRSIGDDIVLVDECDDRLRCRSQWYEIDTWTRLDLPAPAYQPDSMAVVGGGDRWLLTTDWRTSEAVLTDVETGAVVREWSENRFYGFNQTVPISPDGRWLVDVQGTGRPVVVDLESGVEWELDARASSDAVVLIVPLEGTAFGG